MRYKDILAQQDQSVSKLFELIRECNAESLPEILAKCDISHLSFDVLDLNETTKESIKYGLSRIFIQLNSILSNDPAPQSENSAQLSVPGNMQELNNLVNFDFKITPVTAISEIEISIIIACLDFLYECFMFDIHAFLEDDWGSYSITKYSMLSLNVQNLNVYFSSTRLLGFVCGKYQVKLPYRLTVYLTDFMMRLPFSPKNDPKEFASVMSFVFEQPEVQAFNELTTAADFCAAKLITDSQASPKLRVKLVSIHSAIVSLLFLMLGEKGFESAIIPKSPNVFPDLLELIRRPAFDGDYSFKLSIIESIQVLLLYCRDPRGSKLFARWRLSTLFTSFKESGIDPEYLNLLGMFISVTPSSHFTPFVPVLLERVCDQNLPLLLRVNILSDSNRVQLYKENDGQVLKLPNETLQLVGQSFATDFEKLKTSPSIITIELVSKWMALFETWTSYVQSPEFDNLFLNAPVFGIITDLLCNQEVSELLPILTLMKATEILMTLFSAHDSRVLLMEESGTVDKLRTACITWLEKENSCDYVPLIPGLVSSLVLSKSETNKQQLQTIANRCISVVANKTVDVFSVNPTLDAAHVDQLYEVIDILCENGICGLADRVKFIESCVNGLYESKNESLIPRLFEFISDLDWFDYFGDKRPLPPPVFSDECLLKIVKMYPLDGPVIQDGFYEIMFPNIYQALSVLEQLGDSIDILKAFYMYKGKWSSNASTDRVIRALRSSSNFDKYIPWFEKLFTNILFGDGRYSRLKDIFSKDNFYWTFSSESLNGFRKFCTKQLWHAVNNIKEVTDIEIKFHDILDILLSISYKNKWGIDLELLESLLDMCIAVVSADVDHPNFTIRYSVFQWIRLVLEDLVNGYVEGIDISPIEKAQFRTMCSSKLHIFTLKVLKRHNFGPYLSFPCWVFTIQPLEFLLIKLKTRAYELENHLTEDTNLDILNSEDTFTAIQSALDTDLSTVHNQGFKAVHFLIHFLTKGNCQHSIEQYLHLLEVLLCGIQLLPPNLEQQLYSLGMTACFEVIKRYHSGLTTTHPGALNRLRSIWQRCLLRGIYTKSPEFDPACFIEAVNCSRGFTLPFNLDPTQPQVVKWTPPKEEELEQFLNAVMDDLSALTQHWDKDKNSNVETEADIVGFTWILTNMSKFSTTFDAILRRLDPVRRFLGIMSHDNLPKPVQNALYEAVRLLSHTQCMYPEVYAAVLLDDIAGEDSDGISFAVDKIKVSPVLKLLDLAPDAQKIIAENVVQSHNKYVSRSLVADVIDKMGEGYHGGPIPLPPPTASTTVDPTDFEIRKVEREYAKDLVLHLARAFVTAIKPDQAEAAGDSILDLHANNGQVRDIIVEGYPTFFLDLLNRYAGDSLVEDPRIGIRPFSTYIPELIVKMAVQFTLKTSSDKYDLVAKASISAITELIMQAVKHMLHQAVHTKDQVRALSIMHVMVDIVDKIIADEGNIELQTWVKLTQDSKSDKLPFVSSIVKKSRVLNDILKTYLSFDPLSMEILSFRTCVIGLISDFLLVEEFDWHSIDRSELEEDRSRYAVSYSDNDMSSDEFAEEYDENDANAHRAEHQQRILNSRGNVFRNSVLGDFESGSASDQDDSDQIIEGEIDLDDPGMSIDDNSESERGPFGFSSEYSSDEFSNNSQARGNHGNRIAIDIVVENSHSDSPSDDSHNSDSDIGMPNRTHDEGRSSPVIVFDSPSEFSDFDSDSDSGSSHADFPSDSESYFSENGFRSDFSSQDDENDSENEGDITIQPGELAFLDRLMNWYGSGQDAPSFDLDEDILLPEHEDLAESNASDYVQHTFRGRDVFESKSPYTLPILTEVSPAIWPWAEILDANHVLAVNRFVSKFFKNHTAFIGPDMQLQKQVNQAVLARSRRIGPLSKPYVEPRSKFCKPMVYLVARFMFSPLVDKEFEEIKPVTTRLIESCSGRTLLIEVFNDLIGALIRGESLEKVYDTINSTILDTSSSSSSSNANANMKLPSTVTPALVCENVIKFFSNVFLSPDDAAAHSMGSFSLCFKALCDYLVLQYGVELFSIVTHPLVTNSSHLLQEATSMVQILISHSTCGIMATNPKVISGLVKVFGLRECTSTAFSNLSKMVFTHMDKASILSNFVQECRQAKTVLLRLLPSAKDSSDDFKFYKNSDEFLSNQVKILRLLSVVCNYYDGEECILALKEINMFPLWNKVAANLALPGEGLKHNFAFASSLVLLETMALPSIAINTWVEEIQEGKLHPSKTNEALKFTENFRQYLNQLLNKIKTLITELLNSKPNLAVGPMGVMAQIYGILDFQNKRKLFYSELDKFLKSEENLGDSRSIVVPISRSNIVEDSFEAIKGLKTDDLRKKLVIQFRGEFGEDAGGVSREWLEIFSREILKPEVGLFLPTTPGSSVYKINPAPDTRENIVDYYGCIGWILARTVMDKRTVGLYLSRVVYKYILGKPVSLADMEAVDAEYHKSLVWMLENDITDIFYETFAVDVPTKQGGSETFELIPNGSQIDVTEENKHDYVQKIVNFKLVGCISLQLEAIKKGFETVIPLNMIKIFDDQELELLTCGLPHIDIGDWKNNTVYEGYTVNSPQIRWFWSIIASFSNEERAKLLQFTTGTSRIPVHGFGQLESINGASKFCIQKNPGNKDHLPTSHTCVNQLSLPEYQSMRKMRALLVKALNEGGEGFGFL